MAENIFKNIILSIITIYFILNLIYTFYYFSENAVKIKEYEFQESDKMHVETINLEENVTIRGLIEQSFYAGKGVILLNNVGIFIISVLLGSFVCLVVSSKEYNIARIILKIILGNILFNLILSIIYYYNFNYSHYTIYEAYILILINCFILYTIIYFIIVLTIILLKKLTVNGVRKV